MNENEAKGIVEKVKDLVRLGNVSRIVVRRGEREILNISVNAGLVGGAVVVVKCTAGSGGAKGSRFAATRRMQRASAAASLPFLS